MLAAALSYVTDLDWWVIPIWGVTAGKCDCGKADCSSPGKHPHRLVPNGLTNATNDPDVVRKWWAQAPNANVAVCTGPASGIWVFDLDVGGELALEDLLHDIGELPETAEVRTGGGGVHYYFRYPEGGDVVSRSNAFGRHLDAKGRGGYVLAPPSLHVSGRRYEWKLEPMDTGVSVTPRRLLERTEAKAATPLGDGSPIMYPGRNQALFDIGSQMRRVGCEEKSISWTLHNENASRCVPPLDSDEVDKIAAQCASYPPLDPLLLHPEKMLALWYSQTDTNGGYCVSITEYAGSEPPPGEEDDFFIGSLVPKAAPVVLAGPPKSAKSLLVMDAAIHMALGKEEFMGQPCQATNVLFLPLEDPKNTTRRRLWQLCEGHGVRPEELEGRLAVDSEFGFYFDQAKYISSLKRAIDSFHPGVVIVDSLSRSFSGDENSKEAIAGALGPWQDLVRVTGVTVLVIHHFRKATTDAQGNPLPLGARLRGSGDLFAFVRQVVGVHAIPGSGRLSAIETIGNFETQLPEAVCFRTQRIGDTGRKLVYRGLLSQEQERLGDVLIEVVKEVLEREGPLSQPRLLRCLRDEGHTVTKARLLDVLQGEDELRCSGSTKGKKWSYQPW